MKKLLLILFLGIVLIGSVSAFGNYEHGVAITTGAIQTGGYGMRINYTGVGEYYISNVTAVAGAGCDWASIYFVNGTILTVSGPFNQTTGGTGQFTNNYTLQPKVIYKVECSTPSGDRKYNDGGGFPVTTSDLIWVSGSGQNGADDNSWNNIKGIYLVGDTSPSISVGLFSPANNSVISSNSINFTANHLSELLVLTNTTTNVWYNNNTIFNQTTTNINPAVSNDTTILIEHFNIGNYYWNTETCGTNATGIYCYWATNNNSFAVGSLVNSITFQNSTYETKEEYFIINITLIEGAEISLVQLNYNGTNYTISNITASGPDYILSRKINIPVNINPIANQTNTFYFRFTYGGNSIQTTSNYEQNSSFITFVQCGGSYTINKALNFTLINEINQTLINAATNPVDLESSWKYWLGDGGVYKNYSFQNISSNLGNYQFCIDPYLPNNFTFKTDGDLKYSAVGFREGRYFLRNSTLTNSMNNISLFTVSEDDATKFFLTFQQGLDGIDGGIITVQKYFVGLGMYQTVTILQTDDNGEATMWQEVDAKYKYSIVKNGVLLGVIERTSICSTAPCTLTLQIPEAIQSAFESYYDTYSVNVLSNLSYDRTTMIVTYEFIDITGLANYFRLDVSGGKLNGTKTTICNSYAYSSSGTMTCNLTGYTGDFTANTYVSRSPEKLDKILSIFIDDDLLKSLGLTGVLIILILTITILIAAAVMSRGNPSTVLIVLGITLLALKLIGILPFSWILIVALEVLVIWIAFKIKT